MKKDDQHGQNTRSARNDAACSLLTTKRPLLILCTLVAAMLLPWPAPAHRGAGDDTDLCRIPVGNGKIHFAAYTPKFTGTRSYCRSIPKIGVTNLVFDYEGKELRQVRVEFEVTKEPDGERVFYRPPDKSKSGTVEGTVDFNQFGPGNYRAHVTIVENENKVDTHIPFSVGIEGDESYDTLKKVLVTMFVSIVIIFFSYKLSRDKGRNSKAGKISGR